MRSLSILRLVPIVAVLSVSTAWAQSSSPQSAPDPVDQAMVKLGPIGLNPSLGFHDIGRDTNVFNDAENPKSDFTATISPRLELVTHPGPLRFSWTTNSDYVYYQTYSSERGTNLGNTFKADFDFGLFHPSANANFINSKDRFNREIDARARHQDRTYGAGLRVDLFEGVFASAGVRQATYTFDPNAVFRGQNLATTLNRTDDGIDAGGGVELTPLTAVQVTVSRERSRFDLTPERNSQTLRVTPTITFNPLAVLSGTASFGYRRFTTHTPDVPDYHGFVSSVTLVTTAREKHRFDTTFGRDLQYSYEEAVPEYIETGLTAGWNWQMTSAIDSRLYGGRSLLHYRSPSLETGKTDDTAHSYGFSLGWRLNPHLRAALNGDWRGRASERSFDRTYDSRRIYATLTWGKVS